MSRVESISHVKIVDDISQSLFPTNSQEFSSCEFLICPVDQTNTFAYTSTTNPFLTLSDCASVLTLIAAILVSYFTTMTSELVLTSMPDNAVKVIEINRPQKKNALSQAVISALLNHLKDASDDPLIKAIVVTGSSTFFSGLDLGVKTHTYIY